MKKNIRVNNTPSTPFLTYNSAIGKVAYSGNISHFEQFINNMKVHQLNSFLGGTVHVTQLDTPLTVFRTGALGKYWSTNPPLSPWQQGIDLAMHPNIYSDYNMKLQPNWHPANKGVLIYEIPAGTIIAYGKASPQGGWPGQYNQVFITSVDTAKVQSLPWEEYKQSAWESKNLAASFESKIASINKAGAMPHPSVTRPKLPKVNYKAIAGGLARVVGGLAKGVAPVVTLWDLCDRFQQERINHQNSSTLAHATATVTGMALDNGVLLLPGLAPFIVPINFIAELANAVRDIPRESLINNRDILDGTLLIMDIAPEAAQYLLNDFNADGQVTKQFLNATFETFKPFEKYYDLKQKIIGYFRAGADIDCRLIRQLKEDKPSEVWQNKTLRVTALETIRESINQQIRSGTFSENIVAAMVKNTSLNANHHEDAMPTLSNQMNTNTSSLNKQQAPSRTADDLVTEKPNNLIDKQQILSALNQGQADIEHDLKKIAEASTLAEQLINYFDQQKQPTEKKLELAELISAATALTNCILQLTHQTPQAKNFNENKQQIIQEAKSQFLNNGINIDIEKLYATHANKRSNYSQIFEQVNQVLAETSWSTVNFRKALIQKKEAFNEIHNALNQLKNQLNHLETQQQKLSQLDVSITQDFNHILKKIDKIKYDQTYSKLASLTQLTATVAALFGEPVTASIAQAATLALNFFDQQVNQKKSKTINSLQKTANTFSAVHQNVALKNQAVANIIGATQEQMHYLKDAQIKLQSPKEYRESLEARINAAPGEIQAKKEQIDKLTLELKTLREKIVPYQIIDIKYKTIPDSKGNSKEYCQGALENRAKMSELEDELDSLESEKYSYETEITTLEKQTQADQTELQKQNSVKYINDYIYQLQEKSMYADCIDANPEIQKAKREEKDALFKKQSEVEEAIVRLDNQLADKEQSFAAYHHLMQNTANVGLMLGRYANLANLKSLSWSLNKTSYAVQSVQFVHQAYLKIDQLINKFGDGLSSILKNKDEQNLSMISLLPTLLPFFTNPVFSIMEIGDKLVQTVANLFLGVELFPNPTLEQLNQLSKQIADGFTELSKQLQKIQQNHHETQGSLLQLGNHLSQLLHKQDFTNEQITKVLNNQNEDKQTKQTIQKNQFNILIKSEMDLIRQLATKSNYKLDHLGNLLQYTKASTRLEYSSYPELITSACPAFNLINTVAAEIDPDLVPLPNYYMLNLALEIFIKHQAKMAAFNDHPLYQNLKQTLTDNLTHLITFVDNLQHDPSWLVKLALAIQVEIASILNIIEQQNQGKTLLNEINEQEKQLFQTIKHNYFLSRKIAWDNSPFRNPALLKRAAPTYKGSDYKLTRIAQTYERTDYNNYTFKPVIEIKTQDCVQTIFSKLFYPNSLEAKRYSSPTLNESFTQLNTLISSQYQPGNINDAQEINIEIVNCFNTLLLPLFKSWTSYYNTPNAVTVLHELQDEDAIRLKHPITTLGESLSFYEVLRQNGFISSLLFMKNTSHFDYYSSFIYHLPSDYFIEHNNYSKEYKLWGYKRNFPGILLEEFSEQTPPLSFPKALIDNLKQRPEVKQLFWAEELHVAIPIIEYVFEQSLDKKEYFLSIQFSYLFTNDKPEHKKPFVKMKVARFDYITVHALAAVTFENSNYHFNLNLARFLVMAMYGDYIAGNGSYDLARGHDLEQGKSLIFANATNFEGLYTIFSNNPNNLFYYDSSYRPHRNDARTTTERLYDHLCLREIDVTFLQNETLFSKIREKTEHLNSLMHKHSLEAVKPQLEQKLNTVDKLYHAIIHAFKLYTNIDYESLTILLSQHLALPHPFLTQELFETDLKTFQSVQQDYLKHNWLEGIINLHTIMQAVPHSFTLKMHRQLSALSQPQKADVYHPIELLEFENDNTINSCFVRLRQWLYVLRYSSNKNLKDAHQFSETNKLNVHPINNVTPTSTNEAYFYHFNRELIPYSIYMSSSDSFYNLQTFCQVVDYLRNQFTNPFDVVDQRVDGRTITVGRFHQTDYSTHQNTCAITNLRFLNQENIEKILIAVLNTFQRVNPWQKTYIQPFTNGVRYYLLAFNFVTPQHLKIHWLSSQNSSQKLIDALRQLFENCRNDSRFPSLSNIQIDFLPHIIRNSELDEFNNGALILQALQETLIFCKNNVPFTSFYYLPIMSIPQDEQYFNTVKQIRALHKTYVYLNNKTNVFFHEVLQLEKQFEDKVFINAGELKKAIISLPIKDLMRFLQQLEEQVSAENFWEAYSEEIIKNVLANFIKPEKPIPSKNQEKSFASNTNCLFSPPKTRNTRDFLKLNSADSVLDFKRIERDGNCQFSAISEQLRQINDREFSATELREKAVEYMEKNPEDYENLFNGQGHKEREDDDVEIIFENFNEYLERMKKANENEKKLWGDQLTLHALAKRLEKNLLIFSPCCYGTEISDSISIRDNLWCTPVYYDTQNQLNIDRTILLYSNGVNHYDTFSSRPDESFINFLRSKNVVINDIKNDNSVHYST